VCIAPFGWIVYVVRSGDNLSSIARGTGTTLNELRDANCLSDINRLVVGSQLFVPGPEAILAQGNNALDPQGCTRPDTFITSPLPGERVSRVFFLTGTALSNNFSHFRIEIRADDAREYELYAESPLAVVDDVLGVIDSTRYEPGLYWLRLSVIDEDEQVRTPTCAIPLIFESP
jgi:LysM repeat protein